MIRTSLLLAAAALAAAWNTSGCAGVSATGGPLVQERPPAARAGKSLRAFGSEQELKDFFRRLAEEQQREAQRRRADANANTAGAKAEAPAGLMGNVQEVQEFSLATSSGDSVTNVQHAGVDEGGIVKAHGDHLVVLRRGRLFTVRVGGGQLAPVSSVDAFGPDADPGNSWYDEMLVSGDTVAVIGYSYGRGGTEVVLFGVDAGGRLSYRSTYHLRSNDYYSSRNYASRLVGSRLILYTPLYLWNLNADYTQSFPALRKWRKGARDDEFRRIAPATRVYHPARPVSPGHGLALHTVTTCDLARGEMDCQATSVIGPAGRVFYVSPSSVYVWATDWRWGAGQPRQTSTLYRMPLDGSAPSALGVSGSPVDQFSFLESQDRHLNVLVRADAAGDGMWRAEVAAGDVALLRVPLESFSDGSAEAWADSYRPLPKPEGHAFQNRFVGRHLLYGTGSGWLKPEKGRQSSLYVTRWAGGDVGAEQIPLPHGVDRIEVMGAGAVVVGTTGRDLHFTSVALGARPAVAGSYVRRGASQGELRSHGFFYKPEGPETGVLGLPIQRPGRPGYKHLFENSAAVLYLRNESLQLSEVGELAARPEGAADDRCRASCVDWYGNARPLFLRGRVFALLGYEIVEGSLDAGRIRETRRVSFAPGRQDASLR